MEFEFDPEKSASNKDKHGIDFVAAQAIWLDDRRALAPVPFEDETRYILTGMIEQKCWTAIFTLREQRVRIISVRRARDDERRNYESDYR